MNKAPFGNMPHEVELEYIEGKGKDRKKGVLRVNCECGAVLGEVSGTKCNWGSDEYAVLDNAALGVWACFLFVEHIHEGMARIAHSKFEAPKGDNG